jgi:hypothetical protein
VRRGGSVPDGRGDAGVETRAGRELLRPVGTQGIGIV